MTADLAVYAVWLAIIVGAAILAQRARVALERRGWLAERACPWEQPSHVRIVEGER